jgi:hypothetical protein
MNFKEKLTNELRKYNKSNIEQSKRLNSNYEELNIKDFEDDLLLLRIQFKEALASHISLDKLSKNIIDELDFLISQYYLIYNEILISKEKIKIFHNEYDDRNYTNGILFYIKMLFHDIITSRNLIIFKYESQLKSTLRNLMEKSRILVLLLYDVKFAGEFIFNDSNFSVKERYYKLLKPSKILKRIELNYEYIKLNFNKIPRNNLITYTMAETFYKLFLDRSYEIAYDDFSKFTHYNDFNSIFFHHSNNNRVNMSLYENSSPYFENLYKFIIILISKNLHMISNYSFYDKFKHKPDHRLMFVSTYCVNTMIHFFKY